MSVFTVFFHSFHRIESFRRKFFTTSFEEFIYWKTTFFLKHQTLDYIESEPSAGCLMCKEKYIEKIQMMLERIFSIKCENILKFMKKKSSVIIKHTPNDLKSPPI